jgi:hypothetical protein
MTPSRRFFKQVIEQTVILRMPQRRLSTFGETRFAYFLLSEIDGFKDRCRLRRGEVIAERPKILTREDLQERFEGFNPEAREFGEWLVENYGSSLRGLQYQFRNEPHSVTIEHSNLPSLAETIEKRLSVEEIKGSAMLRGPDRAWQISLMKVVVDECLASFGGNFKDLDERGMFDSPEDRLKSRKKTVEDLLLRAKEDRSLIPVLDRKLHEFGLFKAYEDAFFGLFRN